MRCARVHPPWVFPEAPSPGKVWPWLTAGAHVPASHAAVPAGRALRGAEGRGACGSWPGGAERERRCGGVGTLLPPAPLSAVATISHGKQGGPAPPGVASTWVLGVERPPWALGLGGSARGGGGEGGCSPFALRAPAHSRLLSTRPITPMLGRLPGGGPARSPAFPRPLAPLGCRDPASGSAVCGPLDVASLLVGRLRCRRPAPQTQSQGPVTKRSSPRPCGPRRPVRRRARPGGRPPEANRRPLGAGLFL